MLMLRGNGDSTVVLHLNGSTSIPQCSTASPRILLLPNGLTSPSWGTLPQLHVPPPVAERNLFCCGHASLPDGRVLFVGGTSVGTNGHKGVQRFDPRLYMHAQVTVDGLVFRNGWAVVDTLRRERWYPSATALPDGRVLVSSGLRHYEMMSFGGMQNPGLAVPRVPDMLALTRSASWMNHPALGPTVVRPTPSERQEHTLAYAETAKMHDGDGGGVYLMYGGRDATSGTPLAEFWVGWRTGFDQAESMSWFQPSQVGFGSVAARYDHSAVVVPGGLANSADLYVYGGRTSTSAVAASDQLWRMRFEVVGGEDERNDRVTATAITTTGTGPGARYGHTAVVDEYTAGATTHRRMLVFGGRRADGALADSSVYSLDLATMQWSIVTPAQVGSGPSARYRHTAVMDRPGAYSPNPFSKKPRRMIVFGGQGPDSLLGDTWVLRRCDESLSCLSSYHWETNGSRLDSLALRRFRHTMVLDREWNRALVHGGDTTGTGAGTAELYAMAMEHREDTLSTPRYPTDIRWYPVAAELAVGTTAEPRCGHAATYNTRYVVERLAEVYDPSKPAGQRWSDAANAPLFDQWTYPFYFLLPSGSVFYAGRNTRTPQLGATGSNNFGTRMLKRPGHEATTWFWDSTGPKWPSHTAGYSAVMYEPGRIMKFGRDVELPSITDARTATIVFDGSDVAASGSQWTPLPNPPEITRPQPRVEANLTMFPDGRVLATGGRSRHEDFGTPFMKPQIWDPQTGAWTNRELLPADTSRGYHSTALLTPDGRVLSAGGSHLNGPTTETRYDPLGLLTVYEPAYLFADDVSFATRPVLSAVPDTLLYGNCYSMTVSQAPSGLRRPSLIRPGSTTHAFNMDQYFVPLDTIGTAAGALHFRAPAHGNIAPPANALLFGVANTAQRTPSLGEWVTVGPRHDPLDAVAPAAVPSFTVYAAQCEDFVNAYWTETADDSTTASTGRVRLHDIRWSTSSLTTWSQFAAAQQVDCEPVPRGPGAPLSTTIPLAPGSYNFRHVSWDDRFPYDRSSAMSAPRSVTVGGCGGGGGGGPYIDGEGGEGGGLRAGRAADEASAAPGAAPRVALLAHGAPGEEVEDAVVLPVPVRVAPGRVQVRVHRGAGGLVQPRLTAVDRPAEREVVRVGEDWLAVRREPALAASLAGEDLRERLEGRDDLFVVGDHGDTVEVTLPPAGPGAGLMYLDAEASRPAWAEPARLVVLADTLASEVRPTPDRRLHAAPVDASGTVRLAFAGNAAVRGLGRLVPTGDSLGVQAMALVSALHSSQGPLALEALASGTPVTLAAGDTLTLEYAEPAADEARTRELWLTVRGWQQGEGGAQAGRARPGVEEGPGLSFALMPARPNPTRGAVVLPFTLARGGVARLEVYDLQGRRVHESVRTLAAGLHEHAWDLRGRDGRRVAAGIYHYRLQSGGARAERRLVVMP